MMAGIFLGGKHTRSLTVNFFLLLEDYRYNYIYINSTSFKNHYMQGHSGSCSTNGMYHAAPLKLVSWEW